MLKDDWVYVGHMLDMSQKAADFMAGVDRMPMTKMKCYAWR